MNFSESVDRFGTPILESVAGRFVADDIEVDVLGGPIVSVKARVSIEWQLDEERRRWGIKSLSPVVPDQKISVLVEEGDEEKTIEIDLVSPNVVIKLDKDDVSSVQLTPVLVEVDLKKKESTVTFSL